jgi:hypothetical protein
MRIWDLHPKLLCTKHLAAEHRELHGLWNILAYDKRGYRKHPETMRWEGKLKALYHRHEALVREMGRRGWNHRTPLDIRLAVGLSRQRMFVDSLSRQRELLRAKPCACFRR